MLEQVIKNCCIPYREVGQPGDVVVILADQGTDPRIPRAFATAAIALDMEPIVMTIPVSAHDYADPPLAAQKVVEGADLVHYVTSHYVVHSRWGREVSRSGKRKVISDGMTYDMLVHGAVEVDLTEIDHWRRVVSSAYVAGDEIRLLSDLGTDLTVSIKGRGHVTPTHLLEKSGVETGTAKSSQFPGGESMVAPVEDTAEGVVVIDKTIQPLRGLLAAPVKLVLRKGTIVSVEGGDEARWFEQWLDRYSDADGKRLCEVAVGINRAARWTGNLRQDRFIFGSSHLGFGMNKDVGGTIDSKIHYDCAWSLATVLIDGKPLVDHGRLIEPAGLPGVRTAE